jgi:chemotaxis protein MotA
MSGERKRGEHMGAVGAIIVFVCVLGGALMEGTHLHILIQPAEFVIILGAALGSMIIANPVPVIKMAISKAIHAWIAGGPGKKEYVELMQMLFQLFQLFRKDGPQAVEKHIEDPEKSDIFKNYPTFIKNHHAVHFLCDTMKITLSADLSQYDVDDLLDQDIKAAHEEEHQAAHAVNAVSDAMPGLGIVAAVLGVVHTMGILDQGQAAIGEAVAAALVGTFLGILFSYGFIGPTAGKMMKDIEAEGQYLKVIKAAMVALQRGAPPIVCVEFGRRSIAPAERPSFEEVDAAVKKKAA